MGYCYCIMGYFHYAFIFALSALCLDCQFKIVKIIYQNVTCQTTNSKICKLHVFYPDRECNSLQIQPVTQHFPKNLVSMTISDCFIQKYWTLTFLENPFKNIFKIV